MPIVVPRGNMALYEAMVKAFGGIVPGINNVMGSIAMDPATHVAEYLKVYWHVHDREYLDHFSDFYDWYLYPVDLPGKLYLWAVEHLFVRNELFKGELEVAGKTVSLRSITCPVFLLGGDEDDVTPWQQVHNMRYAVGSFAGPLAPRTGRAHWPVHRPPVAGCSTGRRSWLRSASSHDPGYGVPVTKGVPVTTARGTALAPIRRRRRRKHRSPCSRSWCRCSPGS